LKPVEQALVVRKSISIVVISIVLRRKGLEGLSDGQEGSIDLELKCNLFCKRGGGLLLRTTPAPDLLNSRRQFHHVFGELLETFGGGPFIHLFDRLPQGVVPHEASINTTHPLQQVWCKAIGNPSPISVSCCELRLAAWSSQPSRSSCQTNKASGSKGFPIAEISLSLPTRPTAASMI
jgi:hypothetical protein